VAAGSEGSGISAGTVSSVTVGASVSVTSVSVTSVVVVDSTIEVVAEDSSGTLVAVAGRAGPPGRVVVASDGVDVGTAGSVVEESAMVVDAPSAIESGVSSRNRRWWSMRRRRSSPGCRSPGTTEPVAAAPHRSPAPT